MPYSSNPWSKLISCDECGAVVSTSHDNYPKHNQELHTQWHQSLPQKITDAQMTKLARR